MKINQGILPNIQSKQKFNNKVASPFSIPEDSEIFRMKERQKDRKREEKTQNANLKIWEKGVKNKGLTIKEINQLGKKDQQQEHNQAKMSLIQAAKSAIKNRIKVSQPMHEFVSKKRQTLLFQMLIDQKREKINEFQDLTRLHRKGLQRAQQMLQEDMQAFNSYLNQNKKQARDAIKKAQKQTRQKNEKVAIIKQKLQIKADLTGKNMSKKQTLQNLKKYKIFLESLNPNISEEERKSKLQKIEKNDVESQNLQDSEDDEEMYFKNPDQLIKLFHNLEQSNLFLITNLKELQQQIQESRSSFNETKQRMTTKKNQLVANKAEILKHIAQVDEEIQQLKKTTNKDDVTIYYANLQAEVIKMSKEIGFVSADQKHISALQLLKDIQRTIEVQIRYINQFKEQKPQTIQKLQRNRMADKREKKKLQNNEEMNEKAIKQKLGTQPPREKRKGRPIMARSIIKKQQKQKQVEIVQPQQEIERKKYLI